MTGEAAKAAWPYPDACTEVGRISGGISFEPNLVDVTLDGSKLRQEPGRTVIPHGVDRDLTSDETAPRS
jgi:hypothetical protein